MDRSIKVDNSLINLYRQAEDYFFRSLSPQCLDIGNEITAYMTGVPITTLNPVYVRQSPTEIGEALQRIRPFYDNNDLPFEVDIPEGLCADKTDHSLRNLGYSQVETSVAMARTLKDRQIPARDNEFKIESTNTNLKDWGAPLIGAFDIEPEIMEIYKAAHERAMAKGFAFYHYTLYYEDKPISSLTLSIHDKISRIDDVGTLPEFQGKGFATCLMNHALNLAQNRGAHHCFLEASDAGFPLYQKVGFEPLFQNRIYALVESNGGSN